MKEIKLNPIERDLLVAALDYFAHQLRLCDKRPAEAECHRVASSFTQKRIIELRTRITDLDKEPTK